MRITKIIAEDVAKQLVAAKMAERKEIIASRTELTRKLYIDNLPNGLLKQYGAFRAYFRDTTSVRIDAPGISNRYKTYSIGSLLPETSNQWLNLTAEQVNPIIAFDTQIDDMERSINQLRNNIEAALINLRTYANVQKEFPEAFILLPPTPVNTGLAINIKDIRCKLDKNNC